MIKFREAQILKCGKSLLLDATLEYRDEFPLAYISELIIDSSKTYIEAGPSSDPIYRKQYSVGTNTIVEELTKADLNVDLNKEMLFVYVVVSRMPAGYDTCKYGPSTPLRIVVNLYPYYLKIMNSIKNIATSKDCSNNDAFIDAMLLLKGYKYALLTCNNKQAIKIWNKMFGNRSVSYSKGGCGCNG